MQRFSSIFSQLLQLFPRLEFEQAVKKHRSDYSAKGFSRVDPAHYSGGCYRAANWVELGQTSGRGRDDRGHRRHGVSPKRVWVYPLTRDAVERLRGGD